MLARRRPSASSAADNCSIQLPIEGVTDGGQRFPFAGEEQDYTAVTERPQPASDGSVVSREAILTAVMTFLAAQDAETLAAFVTP